jgi:hypothetical protein
VDDESDHERLGATVIGSDDQLRLKRRMHAYVNALGEVIAENKTLKRRLHRAQERLADLVAANRELRATKQ